MERHKALLYAIRDTGTPILFTSLTTMVGLLSLNAAESDAIGEMGIAASVGISVALLYSLSFLPIMLSFSKTSLFGIKVDKKEDVLDKIVKFCTQLSSESTSSHKGHKKHFVLLGSFILTIIAVIAFSQIRVWHNPLSWLPDGNTVKPAFDKVDKHTGGTANIQLLIETSRTGGIKNKDILHAMEKTKKDALNYQEEGLPNPLVGSVTSLLDVVKETNRALHEGDEKYYSIPETDRGIADAIFLFENAGQKHVKRLASGDLAKAQMTLRLKWLDATGYDPFLKYLSEKVKTHFKGIAEIMPTGSVYTLVSTVSHIISDMIKSFSIAFLVITIMMIVILRDIKLGLIAMVPNLIPILFIVGLMGAVDIPIDMGNLLIASIAIGIAVDDTIHYLHHFKVFYDQTGDLEESIKKVIKYAGRAIVSTSFILITGFFAYTGASMHNIANFGMLVSCTILFALLVGLVVTPALLRVLYTEQKSQRSLK